MEFVTMRLVSRNTKVARLFMFLLLVSIVLFSITFFWCQRSNVTLISDQPNQVNDKPKTEIENYQAQIWYLAVTPNGHYLVSAATEWPSTGLEEPCCALVIWDPQTWNKIVTFHLSGRQITALAIAPNSTEIAVATFGDNVIHLIDVSQQKERSQLRGHQGSCQGLVYSYDGKKLFSIDSALLPTLRCWDIASATCRRVIQCAPSRGLRSVNVTPDTKVVITSGEDGPIQLWDPETGNEIAAWNSHYSEFSKQYYVCCATLNHRGDFLATSGPDAQFHIWDVGTQKELFCEQIDVPWQDALVFSSDDKALAISLGSLVMVYEMPSGKPLVAVAEGRHRIHTIAFLPGQSILLTGTSGVTDGRIEFWDLQSGKQRTAPLMHPRKE
jgi:WD40 repeat protein